MKLRYDKNHKLMNFSDSATPYFTEELTPDDLILDVGMNEPKDGDIREIIKSLSNDDKAQLKKVMKEWINTNPISSDEAAMKYGAKRLNKLMKFSESWRSITTKIDVMTDEGIVIPKNSRVKIMWQGTNPRHDEAILLIKWNNKDYSVSNLDVADEYEIEYGSQEVRFSKRIQKSIDKLKKVNFNSIPTSLNFKIESSGL